MEVDSDADAKKEADELKAKGNTAYKARKFEEAVELYGKAWDTYPKDVTFLTNLSGALIRRSAFPAYRKLTWHSGLLRTGRVHQMYRDVREGSG